MIKTRIIKAKNSDKKIAEIHLYGDVTSWQAKGIDEWGCINLKTLTEELKNLGGVDAFDEVMVRINSCGGDVDEGFAIYNYIRSLNKPITTIADGRCHSIASVIFMAGDTRKIFKTTEPIIHNAWAFTMGNADELEETAEYLRSLDEQILDIYAERSGSDKETIRPFMQDDKPMKAETFLELKLCTEILEPVKAYARVHKKTENPQTKNTMSKVKKIFADAFAKLKELGAVFNKAFQTTDGKTLEIDTGDGDEIKEGQSCTIDDAPAADGDYPLEDGRTISVADGKVSAIKEAESTDDSTEEAKAKKKNVIDVKALQQQITELKAKVDAHAAVVEELKTVKAENTQMKTEVQQITEHLKKIKVDPPKDTTRTGITGKDEIKNKKTVEEEKAEMKKIRDERKKA